MNEGYFRGALMTKGHVFFLMVGILLASVAFKYLPRFELHPTANGIVFAYDKWDNKIYACYANGCRKAEDLGQLK